MANPFNLQSSIGGSGKTLNDLLRQEGLHVLPCQKVDSFQLRGRLWELIYALAGKLVYIGFSDHLTDRDLYRQLTTLVLPLPASLLAEKPGASLSLRMYEADLAQATQIWLRYYADSLTRERWAYEFPHYPMPPDEKPPHNRDDELPWPDCRYSAPFGETAPDEDSSADDGDTMDDEDLDALDDSFEPLNPLSADPESADDPDDLPNAWLDDLQRPIDLIQKQYGTLIPPAELTDDTVPAVLWDLLHGLATHGCFLCHTDHLDDCELYSQLYSHALRRKAIPARGYQPGGWFHDLLGSGSHEDQSLWLRYYASDGERESFQRKYPERSVPPREKPKAKRDWRLPKSRF